MIEQIMFLGMGFLAACLVTLVFIPLVHTRAVRLTIRSQDAMPASATEMQAEKDQLRAEFAMSTRRLEIALDEARAKGAAHRSDVAKKAEQIRLLKTQLGTAAADHLCDMAKQAQENHSLEMQLGELTRGYGREIAGQAEENHRSNTKTEGTAAVLGLELSKPKRGAVLKYQKRMSWVGAAGVAMLIVGSLLLVL